MDHAYRDGQQTARELFAADRERLLARTAPLAARRRAIPPALARELDDLAAALRAVDAASEPARAEELLAGYERALAAARSAAIEPRGARLRRALPALGVVAAVGLVAGVALALDGGAPPDCRRSEACAESGYCSLEEGRCAIVSDADCRGARRCSIRGECSSDGQGECVALADADCRDSEGCRFYGRCVASDARTCVEATPCRALCGTLGLCREDLPGKCVATSDVHCAFSQVCTEHGRCRAEGGRCIR